MFWGLVLKTNKRYSQQVTKGFHVSQAVLDLGSINPNDNDSVVQIWLNTDDTDHLLANVSRQTSHVRLDLAFTEGETVSFYSKGHGTVHLSGYLLPDEDDFGDLPFGQEDDEEENEFSEEEGVEEASTSKKQKAIANKKQAKQAAAAEKDDEEDEDDDDSDDLDFEGLQGELEDEDLEDDSDSDDDEDDDDDDDDDDEDEEDSDEEEVEAPPAKQAKFDKGAKQNGLTNGKVAKKGNEQKQKNQKPEKQEQKQKNQQQQQQNQQQKSAPKTLAGGVIVQDLRVGSGPDAKSGRKVSVYYEGRLKSNNKVFDSTKVGDGFKFRLGSGEVIRGWDIGVVGMKVGSKRRITCPPSVAYGAKGAPPQIPGNATLVFDVELRGVN